MSISFPSKGKPSNEYEDGPIEIEIIPPGFHLRDVTDRWFGDSCGPPQEHNGNVLQDRDPYSVGKLAIDWYSACVDQARSLV